jgi:hypothetical protein
MAKVENFELRVELSGNINDPVKVFVDYEIVFSDLDRLANVTYRETCELFGVDVGVGDIGAGGNDLLLSSSQLLDQITATDGQFTVTRSLSKQITRTKANEDPSPIRPKDELRAEVRMIDEQGQVQPVHEVSNLVEDWF